MRISTTILAFTLGLASTTNAAMLRGQTRQLGSKDDAQDLDDLAELIEDTFKDYDVKCKVDEADDSDNGVPVQPGDKAEIECKGDDDFQVTLTFEFDDKKNDELLIELCLEADKRKEVCEDVKIDDLDDAIEEAEDLIKEEADNLLEELFDRKRKAMGDSKDSKDDAKDLDDLAELLEDTFDDYDLKCKVDEADSDNGVPEKDGDKAEIECEGDDDLEVTLTFELKKKGSKEELEIELCVEADKGKKVCEAIKIDDVDDAIEEAEELIEDDAEDLLEESLDK